MSEVKIVQIATLFTGVVVGVDGTGGVWYSLHSESGWYPWTMTVAVVVAPVVEVGLPLPPVDVPIPLEVTDGTIQTVALTPHL